MRRNLVIVQTAVLLTFLAGVWACKGASVNPDGTPGAGIPGGTGPASQGQLALAGSWSGKYASKDAAASLQESPARASFNAANPTDAKSGTFRIELTQITNAYVAGNYTIIDQTTMMLDVTQSTISTIGAPGSQSLLDYTLIGNSFELHNERIRLVLAPATLSGGPTPTPQQPAPAPGQPTDKIEPLVGHWVCTDHLGNEWKMNVRSDNMFYIEVFDISSSRGSIWLMGPMAITRAPGQADAMLTVQTSDVAKYQGMLLQVTMRGDVQADLVRVSTKEIIPCNRS